MRSDTDPRKAQAILGTKYRLLTDVSKLVRSVGFPLLLVALAVKKLQRLVQANTIGGNTSEFSWGHQELLGGSSPLRFDAMTAVTS